MSASAYHSEQVVHFDHQPVTYFGYFVSTSSEMAAIYPFEESARREAFCRRVRKILGDQAADVDARLLCAACALLAYGNDDEADLGTYLLQRELAHVADITERQRLSDALQKVSIPG
jgi:hypothetical protein